MNKQLDILEPQVVNTAGPPSTTDRDVNIYRCGDFNHLVQTQLLLPVPVKNSNMTANEREILLSMNKYLEKQLVLRRNRKITKKITSLLEQQQRNSTYFIALGAGGHIVFNQLN